MSVFSYSICNFSRVKNILSDRKEMLLEDKSLLRKKITRGHIIETNWIHKFASFVLTNKSAGKEAKQLNTKTCEKNMIRRLLSIWG